MSDLEHGRALLRMARADLNALRGMLSTNLIAPDAYFSDEVFGFHAQKAAEKSLKAWIASLGRRYPRTHDLMSLVENLATAGEDTRTLDQLVDLNPFAVEYRYQSLDSNDESFERDSFYQQVQALFNRVSSKINP